MEQTNIKSKIESIFAHQLNISEDKIQPESSLENLGADSVDRVNIIMKLEEEFNVEISDEEAEKINSVNDAINYIESKRK